MSDLLALSAGAFGLVIPLGLFALLAVSVVALLRAVTFVQPYERYVVTDGDDVETVLEEGVHVRSPLERGAERVDLRTRTVEHAFEDVPTSDGVEATVRVSESIVVTDPVAAVTETADYPLPPGSDLADYQAAVSERTRDVLVAHVERRSWDELDGAPEDLASAVADDLAPAFEQWGVALEAIEVDAIERAE